MIPATYTRPLFDLPEAQIQQRAKGRTRRKAAPKPHQHALWLDVGESPPPASKGLPVGVRAIRTRLRQHFDSLRGGSLSTLWDTRDHWRILLPLVQRVSYTMALVDGTYALFVEYRDCDKFPHYRLTWGHLLFGRVDVHIDTNRFGGNIHHGESLPLIQERLSSYLIALGYRPGRARLIEHDVPLADEYEGDVLLDEDRNTVTREYRLFKLTVDDARSHRQKAKELA
jgi:hypothetical protein